MQTSLFCEQTPSPGRLLFSLTVPGKLPSWNEILGMEHWQRYKFKGALASEFLSALRLSESGSLTKTTSAKNTTLTYADTLELFLETAQQRRRLKSASKRQNQELVKKSELKSSAFDKVPF